MNATTSYPNFVTTAEQRRRFDLCLDRASELFEEPRESGLTRQHAIAIYRSDIPTGGEKEHPAPRPDQGGPVGETEQETPAPAPDEGEEGEGADEGADEASSGSEDESD